MTNIIKNKKKEDVQTHIDIAYEIIDTYLPKSYVDQVFKKLPKNSTVTSGTIRNVRAKLNNRLDVLNALVEVALDNKVNIENLKNLTTT